MNYSKQMYDLAFLKMPWSTFNILHDALQIIHDLLLIYTKFSFFAYSASIDTAWTAGGKEATHWRWSGGLDPGLPVVGIEFSAKYGVGLYTEALVIQPLQKELFAVLHSSAAHNFICEKQA